MDITANQYAVARYPGVDDERVTGLLPFAELELKAKDRYGDQYGMATGLLILHWLTLEELAKSNSSETGNAGTITGNVTSEKEGDLSIGFGSSGATGSGGVSGVYAAWDTTTWGRELIKLTKAACFGVGIS